MCANIFYFRVNHSCLEIFEAILSFVNSWLANILMGYWPAVLVLLIAYWLLVNRRQQTVSFIAVANKIYIIIATVAMAGYLTEMLYGWFGPGGQDYKVFIGYRILGPWKWVFWTAFAGAYVLPQLYWFKRLRTFFPLILAIIILMHIDDLVEYFSKDYRDYYSLFWNFGSPERSWTGYLYYLLFPLILLLFLLFRKRSVN